MKKLIIVLCLLGSFNSFCQFDSMYARIEITSVSIQEHRTWIDTSIVVKLYKLGRTDIIKLGKIEDIEIGFQWELLNSKLGDSALLVTGKAFYVMKEGKWQMHQRPTYQSWQYKIVSEIPTTPPSSDYIRGGTGIDGFQIDYNELFYVIRKFK